VLRELGREPQGGLYACVASALFAYLAFEGLLNDLGDVLDPQAWKHERQFFAQPPFRGTLGKLSYLATMSGLSIDKGKRPYTTLRQLDRKRSGLVHPRTIRLTKTITFADPRELPRRLKVDTLTFATDKFLDKVFEDLPTLGDSLITSARRRDPRSMRTYPMRAFTGVIGLHDGQIE
jgi:hypothetical protein